MEQADQRFLQHVLGFGMATPQHAPNHRQHGHGGRGEKRAYGFVIARDHLADQSGQIIGLMIVGSGLRFIRSELHGFLCVLSAEPWRSKGPDERNSAF